MRIFDFFEKVIKQRKEILMKNRKRNRLPEKEGHKPLFSDTLVIMDKENGGETKCRR